MTAINWTVKFITAFTGNPQPVVWTVPLADLGHLPAIHEVFTYSRASYYVVDIRRDVDTKEITVLLHKVA